VARIGSLGAGRPGRGHRCWPLTVKRARGEGVGDSSPDGQEPVGPKGEARARWQTANKGIPLLVAELGGRVARAAPKVTLLILRFGLSKWRCSLST
jgi:hypothetical protein